MARAVYVRSRLGLHLDADDPTVRGLQHDVHLVPTLLLPQVIRAEAGRADRDLAPDLRHDEGVEDPPEQIPVSHDAGVVDPESRAHQTRIGDVALGGACQALEPVARPGRDRLDDEQIGYQYSAVPATNIPQSRGGVA
jgi:hypothetical protein